MNRTPISGRYPEFKDREKINRELKALKIAGLTEAKDELKTFAVFLSSLYNPLLNRVSCFKY